MEQECPRKEIHPHKEIEFRFLEKMARIIGQKKNRKRWFLSDQYMAKAILNTWFVNRVVTVDDIEKTVVKLAKRIRDKSQLGTRVLKAVSNAELDGQAGIQELALLHYKADEDREGKKAFTVNRKTDFGRFPKFP